MIIPNDKVCWAENVFEIYCQVKLLGSENTYLMQIFENWTECEKSQVTTIELSQINIKYKLTYSIYK